MSPKITLLAGIAIGIYVIENLLPRPLPWLRLGLSNAVILCIIVSFGLKYGVTVSLIRTTVGSFIAGVFLTPFFLFGLLGGLSSTCGMWIFYRIGKKVFSLIGISIFGALIHNVTQLFLAYIIFVKRKEIFYLTPIFILLSIITGTISGIGAVYLKRVKFLA